MARKELLTSVGESTSIYMQPPDYADPAVWGELTAMFNAVKQVRPQRRSETSTVTPTVTPNSDPNSDPTRLVVAAGWQARCHRGRDQQVDR